MSGQEYNLIMLVTNREEISSILQSNQAGIKRFSVNSLALFGSAARDHLHKHSDVDILVQFERPTWANYIGLKFYLQDLLGRDVDLVTPRGLNPAVRSSVEKDLLHVIS